MTDALLAWLHFIAIFATLTIAVMQLVLCRPGAEAATINKLAKLNTAYLIALVTVPVTGMARSIWGIKGWLYYQNDPLFYVKFALLMLMLGFMLVPITAFHRWRANLAHDANARPELSGIRRMRFFLHSALTVLLLLTLDAVFLARGFGQ